MIYAPLVMPEVITGLSMLLLFVAVSVDRGFWTVAIAHTTMAMCFVTVIVQSRLVDFDMNLEEAAMDLGAPPLRTFLTVTLPLILPAIAAAWMLAFALSLDDLVIASFTTGPGATTLPIRIYSEVRLGVKPEMNAVCSIMVGVVGVAVLAASLLAKLHAARGTPAAADHPAFATRPSSPANPCSRPAAGTGKHKPDRNDHQRAEQHIGQRPGNALPRQVFDALGRETRCLDELIGGDAEMREDRPDDQRSDQHLDHSASEAVEHPAPVAGKRPALIRARRIIEHDPRKSLPWT